MCLRLVKKLLSKIYLNILVVRFIDDHNESPSKKNLSGEGQAGSGFESFP